MGSVKRGRVCVIGAGPSGMSFLYQMEKLKKQGVAVPNVVCYEKQEDWGGLWNYSWRTGVDNYGELVHSSMYRYLWTNTPKETIELPDYTYEEHFGKPIPSYPPRAVVRDYLNGRWQRADLRQHVRFGHSVKHVDYSKETDSFQVSVKDLAKDELLSAETFDFVVTCVGHFSLPNVPTFPGLDKYPGRILHSHDFRDASEFAGQRVLVIGSSYSGDDISIQCLKYGCKDVVCSYRSRPMAFEMPPGMTQRPRLDRMDGRVAHFCDGSKQADIDAIILCTGYLHNYPFMSEPLRLKTPNLLYPDKLYRGLVYTEGANNRLVYMGAQNQVYSFPMFDVQALWVARYVAGGLNVPTKEAVKEDIQKWMKREALLKNVHEMIDYQTSYVTDLAKEASYPFEMDRSDIFKAWVKDKLNNVLTYRDQSHKSKYTGKSAPVHHTKFKEALDDTLECFLASSKDGSA